MKLIFNDATEIVVQQVESHGDYLRILTVGNTPEQLKVLFTDSSRTARMIVQERGQTVAAYEGYTAFYRTEIYTGKIYGVVMYKQETLPETQSQMIQAAMLVAQMQAQTFDDERAQAVKILYPQWQDVIGQTVEKKGYKFVYEDVLYKTIQDAPDTLPKVVITFCSSAFCFFIIWFSSTFHEPFLICPVRYFSSIFLASAPS